MKKNDLQFEEFASDVRSVDELDYVELPISRAVFVLITVATILVGAIAVSRIVFLSISQGDFYQARAVANVNREKPLPAHRGIITDRYGEVLAQSTETFSVYINTSRVLKDRGRFTETLRQIAEIVGADPAQLQAAVASSDFEHQAEVPLVRNISPEAAITVRDLALPDVTVENDFRREYIDPEIFASVIGYTGFAKRGSAIEGKSGLELYYDDQLRGAPGVYVYSRDAEGTVLDEHLQTEPVSGAQIKTTIDADLQRFFYERLMQGLRDLGVHSAVGLAMSPKTGEVLSLVSLPSYDNNVFMTPGRDAERAALITDKNKPLFNRAINGAYSPGSTIKPLVAMAALHEKVIDPDYTIFSKGYLELPNPFVPSNPSRFLDWKAHGAVDMRSALARSSNVYFYILGGGFEEIKGLGIAKLRHYWDKFGLGKLTGIDAAGENLGVLPSPEEKEARTHQPWRIGDTYNVSIGQGDLLVSPVQLLNFIASIGNNGVMYRPSLVKEIQASVQGMPELRPRLKLLDYSDWQAELSQANLGMQDAVRREYGTAHLLSTLRYPTAGKTGSAQIQNNTKTNAFFVGFGPSNDPEIAVLVLIENAKSGSLNAVPIAKDVFDWYYLHRVSQ